MKKILTLAAFVVFAISSFAQTASKTGKNDELFNAVMNNQKDKAEMLLKAGCDPNYVKTGSPDVKVSLLMAAVNNNYADIAKMMIDAKADVNWKDNMENTAIMYAAAAGNLGMVKLLAEHGASMKVINAEGLSIKEMAQRSTSKDVVAYINEHYNDSK